MTSMLDSIVDAIVSGTGAYQIQPSTQQFQFYKPATEPIRWMINGEHYSSVKDFASALFPDDQELQMMLILKYGE